MQCLFYRLCLQSFHLVERRKKKKKKKVWEARIVWNPRPRWLRVYRTIHGWFSLSLSPYIHNWRCIIKLTRLPVCQICNFSTKRKKGKSQDHHHHQPVRQWSRVITIIELRNIVDRNRRVTSARPGVCVCVGRYVAFLSLSLFIRTAQPEKFYKPIDSQRGTYIVYNPFRCIDDGLTMYYLTNNHSKLYRSSAAVVVVLLYLHAKDSLTSRLTSSVESENCYYDCYYKAGCR